MNLGDKHQNRLSHAHFQSISRVLNKDSYSHLEPIEKIQEPLPTLCKPRAEISKQLYSLYIVSPFPHCSQSFQDRESREAYRDVFLQAINQKLTRKTQNGMNLDYIDGIQKSSASFLAALAYNKVKDAKEEW